MNDPREFKVVIQGTHREDDANALRGLVNAFCGNLRPAGYTVDHVDLKSGFERGATTDPNTIKPVEVENAMAPRLPGGDRDPATAGLTDVAPPSTEEVATSLDDHTVAELREMAKAAGITGLANMRKADLIAALT